MDLRHIINDETGDESSTKEYPSDRPEVIVTVREVHSEESSDETPTTPKTFLGQPLFESPSSIRQDVSYHSDWVSLPALLSNFENLDDREQIFEIWRYKITLDIDAEYAARRDAVANMELEEKLREMAMNDRSLVDMMALVKYWKNGLQTRDASRLVFEAIRLAFDTKLESIKQQLFDLEDTNDDFSDLELDATQDSSDDATEQGETNAEEAMHEFIVSLGRMTPTASDIEHQMGEEAPEEQVHSANQMFGGSDLTSIDRTEYNQAEEAMHEFIVSLGRVTPTLSDIETQMDEEVLEREVHAGSNHFFDGSDLTSIDRTNYSQAEVSTNLTDNEDDSFDEDVLEMCPAIPIEDAVQHMAGRLNPADIPNDSIEETLHDLFYEIAEPPAQLIIDQAVADAAQSLIDLANACGGVKQTSMSKGGTDIAEKIFDPDETVEKIDDDEEVRKKESHEEHTDIAPTERIMWLNVPEGAGHSLPLPNEATETSAEPMVTKPGADDTQIAETISTPSCHTSCDQTCQVFSSFLSTMKELYISPRAFCELLADNIPMLEAMSINAIDRNSDVLARVDNSTAPRCLLGEEIEEATRLRIDAFARGLEELYQQVRANIDIEGSVATSGHTSATKSFLCGVTSLLEFSKLVLHKTDSGGERHGPGAWKSQMSQDINNLATEASGKKKKKKKNKKKHPKPMDDSNAVLECPAAVPPVATYKIRLEPAIKYDSIARSSRNLFRETLERIVYHRLPIMSNADTDVSEEINKRAAGLAQKVIDELDSAPEEGSTESNPLHKNFGQLLEHYIHNKASTAISEGRMSLTRKNGSEKNSIQLLKEMGDKMKNLSQFLETNLALLRPEKLPTPGRLVLLNSLQGVDRYAHELADEIEDRFCWMVVRLWFYDKDWTTIVGQNLTFEDSFVTDMQRLPLLFEVAQNMSLKELEQSQRKLVKKNDFDVETRAFGGDSTRVDKIAAISLVRAMDSKLYKTSETEDNKVTETFTTFDYESYLRKTCSGEDWTCVMLRRGSLSETFRVIRRSDAYPGQILCILRYAPLSVLGLGPDSPPPQLRQDNEAFAWNFCGNFPPIDPDYAEPTVAVPRLLGRRPNILMMDDMGDLIALDDVFLELCPPNRQLFSEHLACIRFSEIGSRLGAWLANLHVPLSQSQHPSFTETTYFKPSKMRGLMRNYKYAAMGSFLEKFRVPDSRELGQRVIDDFDFQFPKDCQVFAVGDLPLSAVLVQMPLVANGRVALVDWEFSGPGRGINGDMAQLLAGVHQFSFHIKGMDYEVPWRAMDGFVEAIVRNYVEKSRPRGSTLVMKKGQSPKICGHGKRRLPPKIATVLRSAFIVYGAELILMAGLPGYKCKDSCCMEGIGECQRLKGLAERGTWFLRMAGKSENEFQDKNWKEICNTEASRGILGLVFDYDTLF